MMIMECPLLQCIGNTDSTIWSAGTMILPGADAKHYTACMQTHLLFDMAKSGMNPKTLQYLMGHSDISVTMNVYTHIGFDDAEEELKRMEEFRKTQAEVEQKKEKPMSQKMFKVV